MNEEHLSLLKLGGKMTSINNYCIEIENIAMLRADWKIETKNEKSEDIVTNIKTNLLKFYFHNFFSKFLEDSLSKIVFSGQY